MLNYYTKVDDGYRGQDFPHIKDIVDKLLTTRRVDNEWGIDFTASNKFSLLPVMLEMQKDTNDRIFALIESGEPRAKNVQRRSSVYHWLQIDVL